MDVFLYPLKRQSLIEESRVGLDEREGRRAREAEYCTDQVRMQTRSSDMKVNIPFTR